MQTTIWLVMGLALGGVFLAYARSRRTRERPVLAVGLVVAALVYVGFAVAGGTAAWVLIELLGAAVFGWSAWRGLRGSALWLAAGWAAHPAWDAGLHLMGAGAAFAPAWYATLCISFDLLVAGYLFVRFRPAAASRAGI